jgi:hypothetical protein
MVLLDVMPFTMADGKDVTMVLGIILQKKVVYNIYNFLT